MKRELPYFCTFIPPHGGQTDLKKHTNTHKHEGTHGTRKLRQLAIPVWFGAAK